MEQVRILQLLPGFSIICTFDNYSFEYSRGKGKQANKGKLITERVIGSLSRLSCKHLPSRALGTNKGQSDIGRN